jgi:hypothetical protein
MGSDFVHQHLLLRSVLPTVVCRCLRTCTGTSRREARISGSAFWFPLVHRKEPFVLFFSTLFCVEFLRHDHPSDSEQGFHLRQQHELLPSIGTAPNRNCLISWCLTQGVILYIVCIIQLQTKAISCIDLLRCSHRSQQVYQGNIDIAV